MNSKPWHVAAPVSWGIALFEYLSASARQSHRVHGHEFGATQDFAGSHHAYPVRAFCLTLYMQQPLKLDYLWAGLCLLRAVYFIFRS
jgi:uncharacterized protein